ncbi:hypothetical protein FRC00_006919, partial [Tulasnella sp. 408]
MLNDPKSLGVSEIFPWVQERQWEEEEHRQWQWQWRPNPEERREHEERPRPRPRSERRRLQLEELQSDSETLDSLPDSIELTHERFSRNALERERQMKRDWQRELELRLGLKRGLTGLPTPVMGQTELQMGDWVDVEHARTLRLRGEWCIIRILLWVWKNTVDSQLDHSERQNIFISSCRLWTPLEAAVDSAIKSIQLGKKGEHGASDDRSEKNLPMSDDLSRVVEFAEYLQSNQENHKFIARNADVGINRLYVHFNRRASWDYVLYDLREQRMS